MQGVVMVNVTDWCCSQCSYINMLGGRKLVFFMKSPLIVTRQIVYFWVRQVRYFGLSSRDAYFSNKALNISPSASAAYREENDNRVGAKAKRRLPNDASSLFLRLIEAPVGNSIAKLFSCSSCEMLRADTAQTQNVTPFKGLMVDGTGTGTLGALQNRFTRNTNQEGFWDWAFSIHSQRELPEQSRICFVSENFSLSEKAIIFVQPSIDRLSASQEFKGGMKTLRSTLKLWTYLKGTTFSVPGLNCVAFARSLMGFINCATSPGRLISREPAYYSQYRSWGLLKKLTSNSKKPTHNDGKVYSVSI